MRFQESFSIHFFLHCAWCTRIAAPVLMKAIFAPWFISSTSSGDTSLKAWRWFRCSITKFSQNALSPNLCEFKRFYIWLSSLHLNLTLILPIIGERGRVVGSRVLVVYSNFKFWHGCRLFYLNFTNFNCQWFFNVHAGPPALSPMSEIVRRPIR